MTQIALGGPHGTSLVIAYITTSAQVCEILMSFKSGVPSLKPMLQNGVCNLSWMLSSRSLELPGME